MFSQPGVSGASQVDFASHYDHLCLTRGMAPIPAVKMFLSQGVLDINGDRIKYVLSLKTFFIHFFRIFALFLLRYPEWDPIFGAIKSNKTLAWLAIRSYYYPPEEFGTAVYFTTNICIFLSFH